MLHDGQEFHVGETHVVHIVGTSCGASSRYVSQRLSSSGHPPPGSQVHFVNGDSRPVKVTALAPQHPIGIAPFVSVKIPHFRSRLGPDLGSKAIWVGFIRPVIAGTGIQCDTYKVRPRRLRQ